ncbi:protein ELC-like [Macadamia integrifolia]|uniref:protein ELC-like n=1 Tax=Macadamia integrifolia TaxID=60698 RepID=UPI001C4ED98F|nr:protein ELC-like [Macadamia integrifolia]
MVSPPRIHPGGGAATQNAQYIQQFLSNVLSQRGPSALPYAEDVKWLIRQHLLALIENYPGLQPKTATFTHNDGRTVNLLQAEGTIPMVYGGVVYNIPVVIWLMESYPRHPCCVYVTPTRDMIIKRPHPHVNPSGLVSHPYLQNWIYPSSNLVDLVRNLSHLFGRDPPLYSRPQRPNPNPSPTPPPPRSHSPSLNENSNSSSSSSVARPGIPPRVYSSSSSPYGGQFPPSPQRHRPPQQPTTEDPAEVYRRNSINKLMEKLHDDSEALRKSREAEMEGLFNLQQVLRQRDEHLSKELRKFQGETEGLEQELQMILMDTDLLESWLRENEGRVSKAKTVEVEEILEPCDALSKQMLECTASDLAIEDVVYSLDKAVQEGSIPFDQYLRNIRSLSREQFFHRAMASKVRSAQMQAQVSGLAARAGQPQVGRASQYM